MTKQFLLSLLLFAWLSPANVLATETVTVGIIVPLTGPAARWGEEIRNGAQLSLMELKPELRDRIALVFEDDAIQPAKTVSAFHKLQNSNFLITLGGGTSEAIAPLVDRAKIPTIAITGAANVALNRKFMLRHWVSMETQAKVLLAEIQRRNDTRIDLVVTENEPTRDFGNAIAKFAPEFGITILQEEVLLPDDRDFRSLIGRMLPKKPDGVVMGLLPGHLGTFAKQLRERQPEISLYGFSGSENQDELRIAGRFGLENLVYAISDPEKSFVERYQNRFGHPPELAAANAYDIIQMFAQAIERECCDMTKRNDYLHSLEKFRGVLGTYGLGGDNVFDISATLKTVKDGKFRLLADVQKR